MRLIIPILRSILELSVTTLAFVLTYHMILSTVINAVVLLVHMAVDVNETRTIVKTNCPMETIAMVMVNAETALVYVILVGQKRETAQVLL